MKHKFQPGKDNLNWKGGKTTCNGYIIISMPNHPHTSIRGYVYEHRLIMEKELGRYLKTEEIVHHINKIKTDNRIENLELYSKNSQHLGKELKDNYKNLLNKKLEEWQICNRKEINV